MDVSFTVQPKSGYVPISVFFQNTSPITPDASYRWDFGDGTTSDAVEQAAFHGYDTPGVYQVSLIGSDSSGRSGVDTDTITLLENVGVEEGYHFSAVQNVKSIESVSIGGNNHNSASMDSGSALLILGALVAGFATTYFLYKKIKWGK